ncbi:MAG: UDP-N-acetylenolpyruvoylglucosamine reductase, partial [Bacteroidales bacterium]|nr:UDP-N-acetylenolpyruvoylglucosamine reductase [Bacteroidales bacterium]
ETGDLVDFNKESCDFGYRSSIFKTSLRNRFVILSVEFLLNKQPALNLGYGSLKQELERMRVDIPGIKEVSQAVINIRRSKLPDPVELGNAGSFFKNPVVHNLVFNDLKAEYPDIVGYPDHEGTTKLAAGWLIEKAGWKGYRSGDAGVHQKQALVLVNYGKATGRDIYGLAMQIQHSVKEKFGVHIEPEVNLI